MLKKVLPTSCNYPRGTKKQTLNSPRFKLSTTYTTMSQVVYITVEQQQQHPSHIDGTLKSQTHPDWIHPHLIETTDPIKGRQFRVSALIPKGTTLLIDRPYAVIPVVDEPATNDNLICSNPACNRPSSARQGSGGRCSCPNSCVLDAVWCSTSCRERDQSRHAFECTWLKRHAGSIRSKWGEYTFGMLWVIVRLLATRHCEGHDDSSTVGGGDHQKVKGWNGIDSLCGSPDTWPHGQVRSWSTLVKKYLQNSPVLPHGLTTDRILRLVCQEEANSFGLYPRETGVLPLPDPPVDRGEQFAAAVYPTAAITNHSCLPNVSDLPCPICQRYG